MTETTKVTYVTLETENGSIVIELLNASKTQNDDHTVQVKGVNYDIFAVPVNHRNHSND
ncbi:hypothetical protein MK805_10155 [Shimazuella sp. AN120528]|uniref:hypothetical protein n=1 Tax=Shimazuella soli TaxID=1892854 RepID=UPI001F0FEDDC|nr:hypothetical protein [Shimazuella soli]MCH5585332.1 hypothetical protein [Shimazuella soli]